MYCIVRRYYHDKIIRVQGLVDATRAVFPAYDRSISNKIIFLKHFFFFFKVNCSKKYLQ